MDPTSRVVAAGAAGAGTAAAEGLYVDDVFSTFLYDGTGNNQTITNDIDLAGEGGMVWIKRRDGSQAHVLGDTERTNFKVLRSDDAAVEFGGTNYISQYNNDGFSLGTDADVNGNIQTYASWTFRKAPGFFDVVTYTGDGTANRAVAHSLGSTPGMIIVKRTDSSGDWFVWHKDVQPAWTGGTTAGDTTGGNATGKIFLSENFAYDSSGGYFTYVNSTAFGLQYNNTSINASGATYVAYIFAHDDQSFGTGGNESIIKCGSYVDQVDIDLGWEPQWIMWKETTGLSNWTIVDNMRGMPVGPDNSNLYANTSGGEQVGSNRPIVTSTGFSSQGGGGNTYMYIAIRRPHKPPTAATEVFSVNTTTNDNNFNTTGFPVDAAIAANTNFTYGNLASARLMGQQALFTNSTASEATLLTADAWTSNTSFRFAYAGTGYNWANYAFKRAPGFFDVVAYNATGLSQTVPHNLEVTPEMIIIKNRASGGSGDHWCVYHAGLPDPVDEAILLNSNGAKFSSTCFNKQAPTSTNFYVNFTSGASLALLFATLPDISKVGAYTGTGSDINVDCGFTAGARFVLIKRTDSTASWYVWDSTRGIVSGNDPYLLLNSNAAEVTTTDYIDPLNSGFTVTSSAPAALNTSGGSYIFLAIA